MASIAALNSQSRLTEVVDLAISDDEGDKDSKTRATAHNSLLNGKNATVSTQNSSSDKVPKNSGIPSHFPKFSKFLELSKAYMKLPADEKIIARLERNHGKLVGNKIESESFFDSLSSKISQLSSSKGIYSILNEGLEFLKAQQEDINDVLGNNKDHVHKARIRKLEKRLEELDRKIKEIQAKEVDFAESDDENSYFIIESKLKEKFSKVYEYLCELTNCSSADEVKIHFKGTRYPEIDKNIRKYLNKTKEFPDYPTILEIVSQTNERDELRIEDIESIAKEAFEEVGKILKQRRMQDEAETFGCYLTDEISEDDPAKSDPALNERLVQSKKLAKERENKVCEDFVALQESLKLEPEEVGDEYEEDEEEDLEEVEEDEVIIEDRKNFSGCSDIMLDDSSSGPSTSKVDPLPSDVKSGFASFTKRSRRTNGQSDGGQPPKIPKCEDEVIVLSD